MQSRQEPSVELTHKPTGESVRLTCVRYNQIPATEQVARQLLRSKLARPDEPSRPTRTYYLHPYSKIKQGDEVLADGQEEVNAALDGEIPWLNGK